MTAYDIWHMTDNDTSAASNSRRSISRRLPPECPPWVWISATYCTACVILINGIKPLIPPRRHTTPVLMMQNIRAAPALCLHDRLLIATEHNVLQVAKYTVYILSLSRREQKIRGGGKKNKTTKDATKKKQHFIAQQGLCCSGWRNRVQMVPEGWGEGGRETLCARERESECETDKRVRVFLYV